MGVDGCGRWVPASRGVRVRGCRARVAEEVGGAEARKGAAPRVASRRDGTVGGEGLEPPASSV
jgi:hypothetical protein